MLVLTRKANQQIQIGDNVVVTILQIKGNTVRVGIEAPREVRVIRGELRGVDANKPAEAVVLEEVSETSVPRSVNNSLSLRQTLNEVAHHDVHVMPLQPGLAASAVADFTPIRQSRRHVAGERRGLSLIRR